MGPPLLKKTKINTMEENKKNFYFNETVKEIVIREGEAPKLLNPKSLKVEGGIKAIRQYIDVLGCNKDKDIVQYCLNSKTPSIIYERDYQNPYGPNDTIKATLNVNTNVLTNVFGINSDSKKFEPIKLATLLKMNKRFCSDRDAAEILIAKLMNFKASVSKKIEKATDMRGNKSDVFTQEVISELPKDLKLSIPVFVGHEASTFFVELLFDTSDASVQIYLISPELEGLIEQKAKELIEEELKYLREQKGIACIEI